MRRSKPSSTTTQSQHQPGGDILTKLEHQKSWMAPEVVPLRASCLAPPSSRCSRGQHPGPPPVMLPLSPVQKDIDQETGNATVSVQVGTKKTKKTQNRSEWIPKPLIRVDLGVNLMSQSWLLGKERRRVAGGKFKSQVQFQRMMKTVVFLKKLMSRFYCKEYFGNF